MAISTCIKCGGTFFEVKEAEPKFSNFKLLFVQCSTSGGVVGVMDFYNIGADLQEIRKHLGMK
jgi:hypothetical protein